MAVNSQADFIKSFGRFGDNFLAHVSEDERVLPPEGVLPESLDRDIDISMQALGLDPNRYTVGSEANSINPVTGQPEFFLGKLVKSVFGKDKDPSKRTRGAIADLLPRFQRFQSTPGMYEDPFGSTMYGREGINLAFSPGQQNIFGGWDDLRAQADLRRGERGAEMQRLFGGGPFTGEVDEALRIGMEQRGQNVDSATAGALSRLFNVGGVHTGTAQQAGELQRRQAGILADLKVNRLKNWLGLRGGYEGDIRGFEKDIMGYGQEQRRMIELLRGGVEPARRLSEYETDLDWDKLIQQANYGVNLGQLQDQKRLAKRSLLDRLAPVADFATMAYLGGGGTFGLGGGDGFSFSNLFGGGGGGASRLASGVPNLSASDYGNLGSFFQGQSGSQGGPRWYNPLQGGFQWSA